MKINRVAVLTGGGDSSGINDFLRTLTILLNKENIDLIGIKNRWCSMPV